MSNQYSNEQIQFIMNQKKTGKTFKQISKKFGEKFGIKKSASAIERTFSRYKENYDLEGLKTSADLKRDVIRTALLSELSKVVSDLKYVPTQTQFIAQSGFSAEQLKKTFGSYEALEAEAAGLNPEIFEELINESRFTQAAFEKLQADIKKYKRFVVTTAVTGTLVDENALASLESYCKKNKAKLLVLPCSDPAHTKDHKYNFSLDPRLPQDAIVFKDLNLNENVFLSTIKLSAKQISPLTGLKRLGMRGSCILASPKQMLEHVATSNKKAIPRALMTTGAITKPDYNTEYYMSERTAYIANDDHKLGAVIVEIKNNKIFFYRRIQINSKDGSFTDINKTYYANGNILKNTAEVVNQPDWHVMSTDPTFRKAAEEVVKHVKPDYMTFEDFFDGISINPHESHNIFSKATKTKTGHRSLEKELQACQDEIEAVSKWNAKKIVFKYGNHEDFLKRWLSSAEYAHDPENHYIGVTLAKAMLEGHMPFEFAMRKGLSNHAYNKIKFLTVNDSFKINGIENGVHGHLGANGKRNPSMAGLEAYGPCTTGHNHSAAILRDVVRVGTATYMQLSYNDGASAWTHTLNIQQRDGARQLITVINGEWCLPDILK